MTAGALAGLQHQQATELDRAEPVAVTSNQIAVPPGADGLALVAHVRSMTSENVSESEAVEPTKAVDGQLI